MMRRWSGLIPAALLLGACASQGRMDPLPVAERGAAPDSGQYVRNDRLILGPPLPGLRFAPSEGTCAPPARPLAFTACCGGNTCNGHCVYADGDQTACSCFGEAGGCNEGFVCSKLNHRCVKVGEDKPTTQ